MKSQQRSTTGKLNLNSQTCIIYKDRAYTPYLYPKFGIRKLQQEIIEIFPDAAVYFIYIKNVEEERKYLCVFIAPISRLL